VFVVERLERESPVSGLDRLPARPQFHLLHSTTRLFPALGSFSPVSGLAAAAAAAAPPLADVRVVATHRLGLA